MQKQLSKLQLCNALASFGEWPFDFVRASLLVPQQEIHGLKNKMIPIDTEPIYRIDIAA